MLPSLIQNLCAIFCCSPIFIEKIHTSYSTFVFVFKRVARACPLLFLTVAMLVDISCSAAWRA